MPVVVVYEPRLVVVVFRREPEWVCGGSGVPVLPERLVCEDEMLHKQVALAHLLEDSAPHVVVAELQPCARHGGVLVHDVAGIRRRGRVIVIGAPLHDYDDIHNLTRGMISARGVLFFSG